MAKEHPRYATTEWPDYEFHEFPMAVYPGSDDGGKTPDPHPTKPGAFMQECVIVKDEAERRAVLGIDEPVAADAPAKPSGKLVDGGAGTKRLETEDDQRAALLLEAETAGVTVDKRWGLARIQDALDEHAKAAAAKADVV